MWFSRVKLVQDVDDKSYFLTQLHKKTEKEYKKIKKNEYDK